MFLNYESTYVSAHMLSDKIFTCYLLRVSRVICEEFHMFVANIFSKAFQCIFNGC